MYDEHYGLSGRPFQLTPDPKFWFDTATHRKAMAYLGYGLSQGEGFIVITGDIGAGKTTLVGHLMATIDRERLHAITLVSTQIEADDLLRIVGAGLEIDCAGLSKAEMLRLIERGLHMVARSGRRTLLIVDEAQALHTSALEELRMLSNFQAGGHALLQIFLLGQPEFRERLNGSSRLEQLRQRVIATHHLDPMGAGEVPAYIHHRLKIVGWAGRPSFTDDAFAALYAASDGVPRRLNQLTGRVLLLGAIEQLDVIDKRAVASVVADMVGDGAAAPMALSTVSTDQPGAAPDGASAPIAFEPPTAEPVAPLPIIGDPALAVSATAGSDAGASTLAGRVTDLDDQLGIYGHRLAALREQIEARDARVEALAAQVSGLDARIVEQEAALRRILTLLIDWIESDSHRPDLATYRGMAG